MKRCPKCRSVHVSWIETTECTTTFCQDETGVDVEGIHGVGSVTGVTGRCWHCQHEWRPRGVRQIWDLPGYGNGSADGPSTDDNSVRGPGVDTKRYGGVRDG